MNELLPFIPELLGDVTSGMKYMLPELALILTFILVIAADLFFKGRRSSAAFWICVAGLCLSAALTLSLDASAAALKLKLFGNTVIADHFANVFKVLFFIVVVLFAVFVKSDTRMRQHAKGTGDLYILLPGVLLGLNLMAMSGSLLLIYISVEMISIASYLMVGYSSANSKQTEAAMKYVLFGSACSAIMLYGMSLLYGFTGTLNLYDKAFFTGIAQMPQIASGVAIIMVLAGIGFKLSFVPFHFWSPDVYEGAPTPVTAFLSTGPKIAGFAVLVRFLDAFQAGHTIERVVPVFDFPALLSCIAVLSMIVGNFVAIWQTNVKRMLAYSSIGHTGFIMMAVIVNSANGYRAMLFYLLIYAMMNMAAFMLAGRIEDRTGATTVEAYKGLGKLLKTEMVCFVIILMSLTGLPPLAGFIGKFLVFSAAFEYYTLNGNLWMLALLITGAVTTVVSLFYYFKIPLNAFLRQPEGIVTDGGYKGRSMLYIVIVLTFLLVLLGVFPGLIV